MRMDDFFYRLIKESPIITIYSHHFPDGDSVGTAMGLKSVLLNAFPDKKIYCLGEDVRKWVHAFGPHDAADDQAVKESLGIVVDHSAPRRAGDKRVLTTKNLIQFDHHIPNVEHYECPCICDPEAVSASQVVLAWCLRAGLAIPKDAIQAFLIAFLDDSVQYTDANRPADWDEQYKIMLDLGGEPEEARKLAYWKDPAESAYEQLLLKRMVEEDGICYAIMKDEDYMNLDYPYPAAGAKSSWLLKNSHARAALLFTYCADEIRLSARSNDDYSVEALCAHFGGGGHEQAAGMIFHSDNFDLEEILKEAKRRVKTR